MNEIFLISTFEGNDYLTIVTTHPYSKALEMARALPQEIDRFADEPPDPVTIHKVDRFEDLVAAIEEMYGKEEVDSRKFEIEAMKNALEQKGVCKTYSFGLLLFDSKKIKFVEELTVDSP